MGGVSEMGDYVLLGLTDRVEWLRELENIKEIGPDLHHRPEYCGLFRETGEARLFVYREGPATVLYPFILRKINSIPGLKSKLDQDLYDITSPYGYGGPLASPDASAGILSNFYRCFAEYCQKNGIVTEFIRFHPLLGNHLLLNGYVEVERVSSVVAVNLWASDEEIWSGYERNNRKNIKKALREGLEVVLEESPDRFDDFFSVYQHTLARNQAVAYYYFSRDFYKLIHEDLTGHYLYAHTLKDGRVISTELLLYNETYIHSFLGGTLEPFYELRPNNILKHEVIRWAKSRGIRHFLLGGGYREGDGIFRYKRSFASGGVSDFYIGKMVHNPGALGKLEELLAGVKMREQSSYFPSYRRC